MIRLMICFNFNVLLVYMTDQTSSLECDRNQYFKQTCKDCKSCPAGYYEKIPCGKYKNTFCHKCPKGKFSEDGDKSCHRCTRCLPDQFVVKPCNIFSDTQCECHAGNFLSRVTGKCKTCQNCPIGFYKKRDCSKRKKAICRPCRSGYYSKTENAAKCKKCTDCPAGQFISKPCTSRTDAVCSVCPKGTYSDTTNVLYYCKPCKRCDVGRQILRHCSATADAVCGNCSTDFFQLQLRNSSQCVRCSECKGKDGENLTIVEECRIKLNDPMKICVPDIIQRHNDLNKTAPAVAAAYSSGDDYSMQDSERDDLQVDDDKSIPILPFIILALLPLFIIPVILFIAKQWFSKPKHQEHGQEHLIKSSADMKSDGYTADWCIVNTFKNSPKFHSAPDMVNSLEEERMNYLEDERMMRHSKSTPLADDNIEENISFLSPESVASSSLFSISRVVSVKSLDKDYKHIHSGT